MESYWIDALSVLLISAQSFKMRNQIHKALACSQTPTLNTDHKPLSHTPYDPPCHVGARARLVIAMGKAIKLFILLRPGFPIGSIILYAHGP